MKLRIEPLLHYSAPQLALEMLATEACVAPADIVFSRLPGGKPTCNLPLHFNCSHSGDFVVCAVSHRPIGVDIERIRPMNPRIFRTLTDAERSCMEQLPPSLQDAAFLRLWTLKESWIKCRGGQLMDYRQVEFITDEERIVSAPTGYTFHFQPAPEGYVLSTCEKEESGE